MYRYIGTFQDANYAPDTEGQLFQALWEAESFLWEVSRFNGKRPVHYWTRIGEKSVGLFPVVTEAATLNLYKLPEPASAEHLERGRYGLPIAWPSLPVGVEPDYVLYIGPRGAIRRNRK